MPSLKLASHLRRSHNEEVFESQLKRIRPDIKCEYEPETFVLFPNLPGTDGMIGAITYTPDYKLTFPNGKVMWVEVKGFARAADHIKDKLADWYITNKLKQGYIMATQFGSKRRGTWGWFRYSQSGVVSRIDKAIKNGTKLTVGKNKVDPKEMFNNLNDFWAWLKVWEEAE